MRSARSRAGRGRGAPPAAEYTDRRYLDALAAKVLVFDGAMGTEIQKRDLTAGRLRRRARTPAATTTSSLQKPEVIEADPCLVPRGRLRRDRDLHVPLEPADDGGVRPRGRACRRSTAPPRRWRAAWPTGSPRRGRRRFVAGSIGPSGKLPSSSDPELSRISFDELADVFAEQAEALIDGDCDLLLIETSQDMLEVKAAHHGRAGRLRAHGPQDSRCRCRSRSTRTGACCSAPTSAPCWPRSSACRVDVIGINCSTGPEHMRAPLAYLGEHSSRPISCLPNAGLPVNVDGQAVYPLQPDEFAREMADFVERFGLNVVGGCCGTTPEHIRAAGRARWPARKPRRADRPRRSRSSRRA